MSDAHGHSSSPAKSSGGAKKKTVVQHFVEGMHELGHETGLGAFYDSKNEIARLFGAEGGEKHH